jgi:hypothetical protein
VQIGWRFVWRDEVQALSTVTGQFSLPSGPVRHYVPVSALSLADRCSSRRVSFAEKNVMRKLLLTVSVSALLLVAPAARAAPTCQTRNGDTIRCATPGAMPVGWTAPDAFWPRRNPAPQTDNAMWKAIGVVGLFLALIALMPEFDGTRVGDWDRQQDDRED